jgi:hypothetical protein
MPFVCKKLMETPRISRGGWPYITLLNLRFKTPTIEYVQNITFAA